MVAIRSAKLLQVGANNIAALRLLKFSEKHLCSERVIDLSWVWSGSAQIVVDHLASLRLVNSLALCHELGSALFTPNESDWRRRKRRKKSAKAAGTSSEESSTRGHVFLPQSFLRSQRICGVTSLHYVMGLGQSVSLSYCLLALCVMRSANSNNIFFF